jgi:hypothetical protein
MMSGSRFLVFFVVIAVASISSGCKKKQQAKPLYIPQPKPVAAAAQEPLPQPKIDFSPQHPPETIDPPELVLPLPPSLKREAKRIRRPAPSVSTAKPEAEEGIEEDPPPELPQLGEVLSEQQMREYVQATEASLEQAKRIAATVQRRPLDSRQADVLGQVQGFIRQAEAAQKKDVPLARNLAQRAEVLAKDLLNSLK